VDSILDYQPWKYLSISKLGTLEEYYLLKRWGEPAASPPLLLLESALEAAAWLAEASSDFTLTFLPSEIEGFGETYGLKPSESIIWHLLVTSYSSQDIRLSAHIQRFSGVNSPLASRQNIKATDVFQSNYDKSEQSADRPLILTGTLVHLSEYNSAQQRGELWHELRKVI
jgi:hypothetical protein